MPTGWPSSHDGGPARAFDRRMPAFGDALTDAELQRVLDYIRGFCAESGVAARRTEPAAAARHREGVSRERGGVDDHGRTPAAAASVGNEFLYEQRLGARSQFEIVVPLLVQEGDAGGWHRGLGDVAFAVKHVLSHSLERGNILSVAGEVVLPTGKESVGLGSGVTIFEPFVAFGQILPADGFLQVQAGIELPVDTERAGREAFWRVAVGKTFTAGPLRALVVADGRTARRARSRGRSHACSGISCRRCRSR